MIKYETVQAMLELHRQGTYIYLTDDGWLELIRAVQFIELESEEVVLLDQVTEALSREALA